MNDQIPVGDNDRVFEAKVTYTTKELLHRIDERFNVVQRGIDHLESVIQGATTRLETDILLGRVNALEQDASGTKQVAAALLLSDTGRWSRNEKVAALIFSVIALAPSVTSIINLFN